MKAKIAEMKRRTESVTNHKLIKNKLAALKLGYKMGILDERENMKEIQGMIVNYAKKNIPLDLAGKRDIGKLLTMVKNTTNPEKLEGLMI